LLVPAMSSSDFIVNAVVKKFSIPILE